MLTESQKHYLESLHCPFRVYIQPNCTNTVTIQHKEYTSKGLNLLIVPHKSSYLNTPGYVFEARGPSTTFQDWLETIDGYEWYTWYRQAGIITVHAIDCDIYVD